MHRGLSPIVLNLLVSGFIMAAFNKTFWNNAYQVLEGNLLDTAIFGGAVFAFTLLVTALFMGRYLQKTVLVLLILIGAGSSYYMDTLGVMIDRDMIQNVVTTTVQESKHLITFNFISHMLIWGVLPSLLVWWVPVKRGKWLPDFFRQAVLVVVSFALCVGLLMTNLKTYSVVLRSHKQVLGSYQPGAPIAASVEYIKLMLKSRKITLQPRGRDAQKGPLISAARKPVLTVVFAGETARAQNFSLNGYKRDTNRELAAIDDVIAFQDVNSCGTATATSLPCMFSRFGRADYSYTKGIGNENLLDILTHAGVNVEWWENNTGDKNIADRVNVFQTTYLEDPEFCAVGECNDGIFAQYLQKKIDSITEDTLIVIHMIGSHGPSYYLRYPDKYRRYTPTCDTSELKNCTVQEIVNTYDNSIAYTDHVVAQTIRMLKEQSRVTGAMVYMSDHGESLGENGIYLHGAPYFMAPEYQTKVPFIWWLSPQYQRDFNMDLTCLRNRAQKTASHANLFHSVLGVMNIDTDERNEDLDVISACRN
jgi:lipid A ethanolaminephosphotransferase